MRKFDSSFRTDLRKTVELIEENSGVELVVALQPRSKSYASYYWAAASISAFLILTVLMFIPTEFWYVTIYAETVGIGVIAAVLLWAFPGILRLLVGEKRLTENTKARAERIFQKAKIYETRERIGILLYFSWFERKVMLITDKGATAMIPADELTKFENNCGAIFKTSDPAQAILKALNESKEMFATYIPADLHPVNELPDDLWMD